MPKAAEKKKPVQPVVATPPEAQPQPPLEKKEVTQEEPRVVFYNKLEIKEYSSTSEHGPLTPEDMKTLLFWETEKQYQERKCKEEPGSKPEHWIFGEVYHCKNAYGEKVRTHYNANNRPFDQSWCNDLIHTVLNGQWAGPLTVPGGTINGEAIRISTYGRVLTGQHQGSGLILADEYLQIARSKLSKEEVDEKYPVWKDRDHPVIETIVITGLSEDPRILMTIDYVKPRTAADVFYTSDVFKEASPSERKELCRMLAVAVDFLWIRTDTKGYKTHPEIVAFLERHKKLMDCVIHLFKENKATKGGDGGRKISKLKISAGQGAALCYLMASSGPSTDGDTYRNESPPTEKGLDFSYWEKAFDFWTNLAQSKNFLPVRIAINRLVTSDKESEDNEGLGGRLEEKLAILALAWEAFKDHPDSAGSPFAVVTQEGEGANQVFRCDDLEDNGLLCLVYSDLDDKGNKMPNGKIKLVNVADFYGIDCPQVIGSRTNKTSVPAPPPPVEGDLWKQAEELRLNREAQKQKLLENRQSKAQAV